mgnify:CR=1 FL=1
MQVKNFLWILLSFNALAALPELNFHDVKGEYSYDFGKAYAPDILKQAIEDNKGQTSMIEIFAKNGDQYKNFLVDHAGGLLYPKLEKITGEGAVQDGGIDRLLKPKFR